MEVSYKPATLSDALKIRAEIPGSILFAGGSDLMVRHLQWRGLTPRFERPVIFIGHLGEMAKIEVKDGLLTIGACCTMSQLLDSELIPESVRLPLSQIASPSIRNIATIGGNIGNASPAGDTLPMLYALDAELLLMSESGQRLINIADFIEGPGKTGLKPDEIIVDIRIPIKTFDDMVFRKVGARRGNSIAKLSIYMASGVLDEHVIEFRMSFGALGPTVIRSRQAESLVVGMDQQELPAAMNEVRSIYSNMIAPIDDQRSNRIYRRTAALNLMEKYIVENLFNKI